jgi:TPR repeat protein
MGLFQSTDRIRQYASRFERNMSPTRIDIKFIEDECERGNAQHQYYLGTMYLTGLVVNRDETKGWSLLEQAAAQDNAESLVMLAKRTFEQGDETKGMELLTKSADLGNGEALYLLAKRNKGNKGRQRELYTASAGKSYTLAYQKLGMQKLKEGDQQSAKQLLKHAQGLGPAFRELAKIYLSEGKMGRAFYWKCWALWQKDKEIQTVEFPSEALHQCLLWNAARGNTNAAPTAAHFCKENGKRELEFNTRFFGGIHEQWFEEADTLVCLSSIELSELTIKGALILADNGIPYGQYRVGKYLMKNNDPRGLEYMQKAADNDIGLAKYVLGKRETVRDRQLKLWMSAAAEFCPKAEAKLKTMGVTVEHPKHCFHMLTGRVFLCADCAQTAQRYCCSYCAERCHSDHKLIDVGTRYEFRCPCTHCGNEAHDVGIPEICSFAFAGDKYQFQPSFACVTCQTDRFRGICRACAHKCHGGHWTNSPGIARTSCCCGSGGMPCCFADETELSVPQYCTYGLKGKKAIGQRSYECKTCNIKCCQRCAVTCHRQCRVEYAGFKRSTCECGPGCKCVVMPDPPEVPAEVPVEDEN